MRERKQQWKTLDVCTQRNEVAELFPQKNTSKYQSVPHRDGNGRPQGEEPCDVTTVQLFRQDARRGKAPFEH